MLSRQKTNASPKYPKPPHHPIFLLPSLKIPFFRRRRQSSTTTTSSAISNDAPSLSSSPISTTSTASTEAFPSSPTAIFPGVDTYTYQTLTDKSLIATPSDEPVYRPTRSRLTSTNPDVLRCSTCATDLAYGLQIVSKGFTGRHGRALLVGAPLPTAQPSCPASPPDTAAIPMEDDVIPGHHALAHQSANLVNVTVSSPEARNLVTGAHVVADIRCATCGVVVGWKYVDAREQTQKYKVGKFILETERTVLVRSWEDMEGEGPEHFYSSSAPVGGGGGRKSSSTFGGRRKESCSSDGPGHVDAFIEEDEGSSGAESEEEITFDSDDEDECEDIFAGVWDAATVAKRRGSKVISGNYHDSKKGRTGARNR